MTSKYIKNNIRKKVKKWLESIDDSILGKKAKEAIEKDLLITGGCIVSLLTNETPNDYDCYFRTIDSAKAVAEYYIGKTNTGMTGRIVDRYSNNLTFDEMIFFAKYEKYLNSIDFEYFDENDIVNNDYIKYDPTTMSIEHLPKDDVEEIEKFELTLEETMSIEKSISSKHTLTGFKIYVKSDGMIDNTKNLTTAIIDDETEPNVEQVEMEENDLYEVRYISSNAITLTDKIQIVTRFQGEPDVIHENFDFQHCKGIYDYGKGILTIPNETYECIINKRLVYHGSKYPLCSIIRIRKFLDRGWSIDASQIVKMCFQLQAYDLKNLKVLEDQLTGVDSAYFAHAIKMMSADNLSSCVDEAYLFKVLDKLF